MGSADFADGIPLEESTNEALRDSLNKTKEALQEVTTQLQLLGRKTFWNRVVIVLLVIALLGVMGLGLLFQREAHLADTRFRVLLLENCQTTNKLKADILEEESRLIEALATITEADPAIIETLENILIDSRDGSLDPIDCEERIS